MRLQGNLRGAEQILEEVLFSAGAIYEPDHRVVGASLYNLALIARERADPDRARRYATQSMASEDAHEWFVLIPDSHPHAPYISDLAGFDPGVHRETPESVVAAITAWLFTRHDSPAIEDMYPARVIDALPRLFAAMEQLKDVRWAGSEPLWSARLTAAGEILKSL